MHSYWIRQGQHTRASNPGTLKEKKRKTTSKERRKKKKKKKQKNTPKNDTNSKERLTSGRKNRTLSPSKIDSQRGRAPSEEIRCDRHKIQKNKGSGQKQVYLVRLGPKTGYILKSSLNRTLRTLCHWSESALYLFLAGESPGTPEFVYSA